VSITSNVRRLACALFVAVLVAASAAGAASDTQPPTAPGSLTAIKITQTRVKIGWTASTDNVRVTGYTLYRNGTQVVTRGASATSYAYTGLACGTTYTLAVDAYDAAGNHSPKTSSTFTTSSCSGGDTQAPTTPGAFAQTSATQTSVSVSWTASTDDVGVTGYTLYRNGAQVATQTGTTYTFTGLTCGTSYALAVDAYDAAGNHSAQASITKTTNACSDSQAPSTPTGLATSGVSQTGVTLSWSASSDNVGVAGYTLYRNGTQVAAQTGTSYAFTGLTCGTSYTLAVDAYDAAGNHSVKASTTATTSACASGAGVYMSPSGSDGNPCTASQPCLTVDRAYHVAAPGGTVELAAGTYSGGTVNPDASKTSSADVVFRPAAGASVTITGTLDVHAAHMEFRDMTVNEFNFPRQADDVTARNVVNHGVWMQGASNISFIGGEITCGFCAYHSHIENGGSDSRPPTNILFEGVSFHDWHSVSGEHTECLQILGGDNVTIRNSTFNNCGTGNGGLGATGDLFVGFIDGGSGPVTKNILLENNFFYPSGNPYAIQMSDLQNLDLRYNSISGAIIMFDRAGPGTGMDFVGNIMRFNGCTAESNGVAINWRYNVMQGGICGSTDRNAAAGFVDANSNLHLAAASAAINAGDPTSYPARDIDGQTRPAGAAPDAGADEMG
jgi:chitodextrinase